MKSAEILAFAERFMDAIERGDADGARACYAPDAAIWHNHDGIEQTVDQNIRMLAWTARKLPSRHYRVLRRVALEDGFLQTHILEGTTVDGKPFKLDACVIVRMEDGLIVRLDEYFDSARTTALSSA